MNSLHDLIARLQKIQEAEPVPAAVPAPAEKSLPPITVTAPAPAPAAAPETMDQAIDRREKAAMAKQILKNAVKKKADLDMVNGYYIEAETGTLLHNMIANRQMAGQNSSTVVTTRDISFGQGKEFADQLTNIGLKITPEVVNNPGIFGWKWTESSKTILKINLKDLERIAVGAPPTQQPPAPAVPVAPAPAPVAPAPVAPAPITGSDQTPTTGLDPKDVAEFRDILTKLGAKIPSQYSVSAAPNNIVPRAGGLAGSLKEDSSIKFKSLIGRALLEDAESDAQIEKDKLNTQNNGAVTDQIKLKARATALYDKLLPFKTDLEVSTLLAAYKSLEGPETSTSEVPVKPPVKPVKPVKPVTNNDQTPEWPPEWQSVKIKQANEKAGKGPNGQAIYILGDGTPKRAFAYYRQESMTLVPMNINQPRNDLPGYKAIPWKTATSWGSAAPAAPAAPAAVVPSSTGSDQTPIVGNVPKQPTLNGKPSNGPKGQAWMKKYGATHNPDGTPKAPAAAGTAGKAPAGSELKAADIPWKETYPDYVGSDLRKGPDGIWRTTNGPKPGAKADVGPWVERLEKIWAEKNKGGATVKKEVPTKDPRGNPLIKDKDGNLGYFNNPMVTSKGFTIVVPKEQVKEEVGFASDELSRIVSLVHHR